MKKIIFIIFFILTLTNLYPQIDLEWKEMAACDDYLYKGERFWDNYSSTKGTVKANILRAKKLGFNMVRVPISFMPKTGTYDHGWPSPVTTDPNHPQPVSSGMTNYLRDIKELIGFCKDNDMKVNLVLFWHGFFDQNSIAFQPDSFKWINNYVNIINGIPPSHAQVNLWLIDATTWISHIIDSLPITEYPNIVVFELMNEAFPHDEVFTSPTYPINPMDIFLLEMPSFLRQKYPTRELMISLHENTSMRLVRNMRAMLQNAYDGVYTRPSDYTYATISNFSNTYYNYFSFHNYNTYSYFTAFQDVLNLGPMQPARTYSWHLGEMGFDIGTTDSYEDDQAKHFLSQFQMINEIRLKNPTVSIKGLGIWSTFDYTYPAVDVEKHSHLGLINPDNSAPVSKRKAAYVVENFLEGLVDNPKFDIGPGSDGLFDDSPLCNGWTPWWDGIPTGQYSDMFTYNPTNKNVTIWGLRNKQLGWAGTPGGKIRVLPGSKIKLSVDVLLGSGLQTDTTSRIFPYLVWVKEDGTFLSNTSTSNRANRKVTTFQTIYIDVTVPENAYYAIPYLMAWYVKTDVPVTFDNVKYRPEAFPLIELNFTEDRNYYDDTIGVEIDALQKRLGWTVSYQDRFSIQTINMGNPPVPTKVAKLSEYGEINSTHYSTTPHQITSIRLSPEATKKYYRIEAYAKSINSQIHMGFHTSGEADLPILWPSSSSSLSFTENVEKRLYSPFWVSAGDSEWLNLRILGLQGDSYFKYIVIYEKNPNYFYKERSEIEIGEFDYELFQNFPNPFNPSTTIVYEIPLAGKVTLRIYNSLGQVVDELINEFQDKGKHSINFNAKYLSSGIYFYELKAGSFTQAKKMLLIK